MRINKVFLPGLSLLLMLTANAAYADDVVSCPKPQDLQVLGYSVNPNNDNAQVTLIGANENGTQWQTELQFPGHNNKVADAYFISTTALNNAQPLTCYYKIQMLNLDNNYSINTDIRLHAINGGNASWKPAVKYPGNRWNNPATFCFSSSGGKGNVMDCPYTAN